MLCGPLRAQWKSVRLGIIQKTEVKKLLLFFKPSCPVLTAHYNCARRAHLPCDSVFSCPPIHSKLPDCAHAHIKTESTQKLCKGREGGTQT